MSNSNKEKPITIRVDGTCLTFHPHAYLVDNLVWQGLLQIEFLTVDFEVHADYKDKRSWKRVFREFHFEDESIHPRLAAIELNLYHYLISLGIFERVTEDGLPCLTLDLTEHL